MFICLKCFLCWFCLEVVLYLWIIYGKVKTNFNNFFFNSYSPQGSHYILSALPTTSLKLSHSWNRIDLGAWRHEVYKCDMGHVTCEMWHVVRKWVRLTVCWDIWSTSVICDMWSMKCYMWYVVTKCAGLTVRWDMRPLSVTCGMRYVTCDMWHEIFHMWHVTCGQQVRVRWDMCSPLMHWICSCAGGEMYYGVRSYVFYPVPRPLWDR